jgi:CIC family chloride channel protein
LRLPSVTQWFHPAAGGLLVGLSALFIPEVLGVGYSYVGEALNGGMLVRTMALLVVLKLVTVALSYASGNAGGIFGPSLFMGAMLGGSLGTIAHLAWPSYTASSGAYALVGMGTAFAGIIRAPMTSVLMIFETTRDYTVIVPLMISNLLSFFISVKLQPKPIYEALALQDGIHLPGSEVRQSLYERRVAYVMRSSVETLSTQTTVREALRRSLETGFRSGIVAGETGVIGIAVRPALEQALADGLGEKPLSELAASFVFAYVHKDQPVHVALEKMGAAGVDLLPIVSRARTSRLEGAISLTDILKAYGLIEAYASNPAKASSA